MQKKTQRRLVAIASAGVVAYSRHMGPGEACTLAGLRAHRAELIDDLVARFDCRIFKTMGGGLLLECSLVVEPTQCSVKIHQSMAAAAQGIDAGRRIVFRIGINLGDIIIEGADILGDGVDFATCSQKTAPPGRSLQIYCLKSTR